MQTLRSLGAAKASATQGLSSLSSTATPKPESERRERKSLLKKPLRSPAPQANVQTDAATESPLLFTPDSDALAMNNAAAQRRKSRDPNRDKGALTSSSQHQRQLALSMPWSSLACNMRCFASLPWRKIGKLGSLQPVVTEAELPQLSDPAESSLQSLGKSDTGAKTFCIELEIIRTDELQFGISSKPQVRVFVVDLCTGRMLHPTQTTMPASFLPSKQQASTWHNNLLFASVERIC